MTVREIELDSTGNIQSIAKFDFDKLASNNIRPRFAIVNENKPLSQFEMMKKNKTDVKVQLTYTEEDNNSLNNESSNANSKLLRYRKSPPRRSKQKIK